MDAVSTLDLSPPPFTRATVVDWLQLTPIPWLWADAVCETMGWEYEADVDAHKTTQGAGGMRLVVCVHRPERGWQDQGNGFVSHVDIPWSEIDAVAAEMREKQLRWIPTGDPHECPPYLAVLKLAWQRWWGRAFQKPVRLS